MVTIPFRTPLPRSATWLIDHVLPKGRLWPVVGPIGAGKTFLLIDWALSIATGTPWCGHPATQQRVLYVRPDRRMLDFLHRAEAWHTLRPHIKFERAGGGVEGLFTLDVSRFQDDQAAYRAVLHLSQEHDISLVILDEWWFPWGQDIMAIGRDLQRCLNATVVCSIASGYEGDTESAATFWLEPTSERREEEEKALILTFPDGFPVTNIELALRHVDTPGFAVDSYGESCAVLSPPFRSSQDVNSQIG